LRGRRANRGYAGAGIAEENAATRRRERTQVGCVGQKRDVTACRADRRRSAGANGLRAVCGYGDALGRRGATGTSARAGVPDKHIGDAVRVAAYQIRRRREKGYVAPVGTDRGRNAVSISGVAVEPNRRQRDDRHAAQRRSRARITHKDVLRCSRNLSDAISRSQHKHGVALVCAFER